MRDLRMFLKEHKTVRENQKLVLSESFKDESGEPLVWEIKPLTTKENEKIRDKCMGLKMNEATGKPEFQFNTAKYNALLLSTLIVYPNLNDKELQDSYGVKKPEELIVEMLDVPGEYEAAVAKVTKASGKFAEKVEEAKN